MICWYWLRSLIIRRTILRRWCWSNWSLRLCVISRLRDLLRRRRNRLWFRYWLELRFWLRLLLRLGRLYLRLCLWLWLRFRLSRLLGLRLRLWF
jgi:hypothetical protein